MAALPLLPRIAVLPPAPVIYNAGMRSRALVLAPLFCLLGACQADEPLPMDNVLVLEFGNGHRSLRESLQLANLGIGNTRTSDSNLK